MTSNKLPTPFNSSLESGVRALVILVAAYPNKLDLQRLVDFDYLVVHSGDAGGPDSLHAPLPLRTGELLIRRELIEKGLMLMISRGLCCRIPTQSGIQYIAGDNAVPFIDALTSPYLITLKDRAKWVTERFSNTSQEDLQQTINQFFKKWTTQFQFVEFDPE